MSNNSEIRKVMSFKPGDEKRELLARNNIFFLNDEIDEGSSYMLSLGFLYSHFLNKENKEVSDKPLWIILNSPGGFVHQGFAIYDSIAMLVKNGREINILGVGMVASMATFILQAATKRYSLPHTQFLIHQISQTMTFFEKEEVNEGEERIEESKRINEIMLETIAKRCGVDIEELKKLSKKKDFWLSAEQAKSFGKNGLIDEVIEVPPFLL